MTVTVTVFTRAEECHPFPADDYLDKDRDRDRDRDHDRDRDRERNSSQEPKSAIRSLPKTTWTRTVTVTDCGYCDCIHSNDYHDCDINT